MLGFFNDYLLFIPKGTALNRPTFLLVEPNNTGSITDDMTVHRRAAMDLASKSSVGNNVSTELRLPLLVPIFPRPSSKPLVYTHALDRDAMLETDRELHRLDLQLLQMIDDAQKRLYGLKILTDPQVFMSGFSASGSFVNRFSLLHPGRIKALAIGGFNGELMLPQPTIENVPLNYPLGINDFGQLFGQAFRKKQYQAIEQWIYMGALDDNDAVQYDDAYSTDERQIINTHLGATVQPRFVRCMQLYNENGISAVFNTYQSVGHWTTSEINLAVIHFFKRQLASY